MEEDCFFLFLVGGSSLLLEETAGASEDFPVSGENMQMWEDGVYDPELLRSQTEQQLTLRRKSVANIPGKNSQSNETRAPNAAIKAEVTSWTARRLLSQRLDASKERVVVVSRLFLLLVTFSYALK